MHESGVGTIKSDRMEESIRSHYFERPTEAIFRGAQRSHPIQFFQKSIRLVENTLFLAMQILVILWVE
jgi:hypothetical protein